MQQSAGVREAMLRFYEAFSANDVASFDRLVSREPQAMAIGTAPQEWMEDREAWKAAFGMEGIRLEGGDSLYAYEHGPVGWLADRAAFVLPDGTAINCRLTAVMCQEDGEWRLVQAHFSVGVPDEQAVELSSKAGAENSTADVA